MSTTTVLLVNAAVVLALLGITWVVSLPLRNASIVDIIWGLAFVSIAWATFFTADGHTGRRVLLTTLTTIWGLRLALYLFWRNHGKGEDYRYRAMRRRNPETFPRRSLVTVFGLQAVLAWIVALPVQLGQLPDEPGAFAVLGPLGAAVWLVGFVFETVGDLQLARFKADPANDGKVMRQGLWRYTRHPNYFGDFAVWWGLFLVAASTWTGVIGIVGPIVMSVLLLRVSGAALLERSLAKRKPDYADYVASTNAFFPGPPRR